MAINLRFRKFARLATVKMRGLAGPGPGELPRDYPRWTVRSAMLRTEVGGSFEVASDAGVFLLEKGHRCLPVSSSVTSAGETILYTKLCERGPRNNG